MKPRRLKSLVLRVLSAREWNRFLEILDDDTVTPAMARAAKRYRERTKRP